MEIRTTYVCDGAMYCGFKPEGVEVKEERQVLYPAEGYKLKKGDRLYSCVWLKNGDVQENYSEVEVENDDSKRNTD